MSIAAPPRPSSVVMLLADGLRPDTLARAIASGAVPALARLRDEGSSHTLTTCFPSVTGPAYAPFLTGRFPGPIGLPGLRWFDRARTACHFPDYARSYVGYQIGAIDRDLSGNAPTIFELCDSGLGALNMISRGLPRARRVGALTLTSALRAARTHFLGSLEGWLDVDREVAQQVRAAVRTTRPQVTFAALTGVDKVSHSLGHDHPMVAQALRIVDDAVAMLREDAEREGRWETMSLWVVSDHGHAPVTQHEDLVKVVQAAGFRTMSHPWLYSLAPEIAVMVSGNAMAHLYTKLSSRARPDRLDDRARALADALATRPSVDLVLTPDKHTTVVSNAARGRALVWHDDAGYHYVQESGDPLGIGRDLRSVDTSTAHDATIGGDYPDAVVQIAHLASAPRSGDIILSATRGWDLRARYEPIPHASSHGALLRDHMLVPLLTNHPVNGTPRRTVDVMPSALAALRQAIPDGLHGISYLE